MLLTATSLSLVPKDGSVPVFQDISLTIDEKQMACVTGPNGSGKTMLGITVTGLLPLYSGNLRLGGSIQMFGRKVVQGMPHNKLGVVLENPYTQLSGMKREVFQEMAFPLECLGVDREKIKDKVYQLAAVFGIYPLLRRNIRTLSGGELQRMIVACAIITDPEFLFLDRPLTEIDSQFRKSMIAFIGSYLRKNAAGALIAEDPWLLDMQAFDHHLSLGENESDGQIHECQFKEMAGEKTVLEIEGLSFSYNPDSSLIDSLSFSLKCGELLFVEGKNGTGKTTLAKLISGILLSTDGSVIIDGSRADTMTEWERLSAVGYALQDPSVQICRNSVEDELALAERCGNPAGEFEDILELGDLRKKHPFELLQAEKKRLGMALACGGKRKVVILDEPSQNQDNRSFAMTACAVRRCLELNRGVIIISHDPRFHSAFPGAGKISLD